MQREFRSVLMEHWGILLTVLVFGLIGSALTIARIRKLTGVPEPPLAVMVRPSHTGIGYVLMVHNASEQSIREVNLFVENPRSGGRMSYTIPVIAGDSTVEVGWMETGWVFERIETLAVEVEGYQRMEGTIEEVLRIQEEWADSKFRIQARE